MSVTCYCTPKWWLRDARGCITFRCWVRVSLRVKGRRHNGQKNLGFWPHSNLRWRLSVPLVEYCLPQRWHRLLWWGASGIICVTTEFRWSKLASSFWYDEGENGTFSSSSLSRVFEIFNSTVHESSEIGFGFVSNKRMLVMKVFYAFLFTYKPHTILSCSCYPELSWL